MVQAISSCSIENILQNDQGPLKPISPNLGFVMRLPDIMGRNGKCGKLLQ